MNNKYGKFLVHGLLITALTFGSFVSDAGADDGLMVHQAGGLPYVSGGVGEESLQQLKDHVSEFNLKLVFAMTSGSYLSDVRVAIADAKGKTLLEATSDGPWFLAKLPGGRYRVVASYAGKAIERSIAVDAKALKTVEWQKPVTFSDFAGEFFLIWFFPIGIWIIQPRINKLFDATIGAENN